MYSLLLLFFITSCYFEAARLRQGAGEHSRRDRDRALAPAAAAPPRHIYTYMYIHNIYIYIYIPTTTNNDANKHIGYQGFQGYGCPFLESDTLFVEVFFCVVFGCLAILPIEGCLNSTL